MSSDLMLFIRSFATHIEELRKRIIWAAIALVIGMAFSAFFSDRLLVWLAYPLPGEGLEQLEAISVTENIGVFMQAALLGGLILAMPMIVYQLWAFIKPALYPNELKYVYRVVPLATLLFLAGVAFCYFFMLPVTIPFLLEFLEIPTHPRPSEYFPFVTSLLFWVGISFETPILIFFLAKVRIVNYRQLLKNWRAAIIIIAVLAAVITPTPDPITMSIVMVPLIILYGLSIVLAWFARPNPAEAKKEE